MHLHLTVLLQWEGKTLTQVFDDASYVTSFCNGSPTHRDLKPTLSSYDMVDYRTVLKAQNNVVVRKGTYELYMSCNIATVSYGVFQHPSIYGMPHEDTLYISAGKVADWDFEDEQDPYYTWLGSTNGKHFVGRAETFHSVFNDSIDLRLNLMRDYRPGASVINLDVVFYAAGSEYLLHGYDLSIFNQLDMDYSLHTPWKGSIWSYVTIFCGSSVTPTRRWNNSSIKNDSGIGPELDTNTIYIPHTAPGVYNVNLNIGICPMQLLTTNSEHLEVSIMFNDVEHHLELFHSLLGKLSDVHISNLPYVMFTVKAALPVPLHNQVRIRLRGLEASGNIVKGTVTLSVQVYPAQPVKDIDSDFVVV